jgi:GTP-binding protein
MNYTTAAFEIAAGLANQLVGSTVPEIVFVGRSNVGKSSLINKIVNRKALARTSSQPGKTSTINFYKLDSCRFVDLPGYGYAKVSNSEKLRWGNLINGYLESGRNVKLILQIVDMRHELSKDDCSMMD